MPRLFDLGVVALGLVFEILRVTDAEARHQHAEQHSEAEHDQQTFGGAASGGGEFAFTVLKCPLVGKREFAEGIVELAAARHYLTLQKLHRLPSGRMHHGAGQRIQYGPEFVQTLPKLWHDGLVPWMG